MEVYMAKAKKSGNQAKKIQPQKKAKEMDLMHDLPFQQLEDVQRTLSDSE